MAMTVHGLAEQLISIEQDYEVASIYTSYKNDRQVAVVTCRFKDGSTGRAVIDGDLTKAETNG